MSQQADILLNKKRNVCPRELLSLFLQRIKQGHLGVAKIGTNTQRLTVRSLFISDLHLGMAATDCQNVRHLLENVECQNLVMIGDILDGWALERRWNWTECQETVFDAILMHAAKPSCHVTYIPGNHDEFWRSALPADAPGNIHFSLNMLFKLADGRQFWVSHGDEYDTVTSHAAWLSHFGSVVYENSIYVSKAFKHLQQMIGLPGISVSRELKNLAKYIFQPAKKFQKLLSTDAKKQGAVGVLCGHIHRPEILITDQAICYANAGDFVESSSAIIEDFDGRLSLIYWTDKYGLKRCIREDGKHS